MYKTTLPEPILVGRKNELEKLKRFLDLALEGKGTTAFISGEAGSGKTRLITEFIKTLNKEDVIILTGWCLSEAPVPYFPFIEAFDSRLSANEGKNAIAVSQRISLKSWLLETNKAEVGEKTVGMQSQIWRDHAFYGVANELLFLASKKPLVLVLEDIHWADSASLSLLHYIARQLSSERILLLATFRREELRPEAEGHPHPLSKTLLLMDRDDLYKEVRLTNLRVPEVCKIAESMLGGAVQSEFVKKLVCESHGNPLFVIEYLRMLHQQGKLFKENGRWGLSLGNLDIPRKVKDVITQRLESLKAHERKILDIASVVGKKFDPELIATVLSQDRADVLRTVTDIAKTTFIVHCEGNSCRFGHSKFREMLYMEIPSLLRKEYHLRIAEKIEEASKGLAVVPVSDLVYHFVHAENKPKAIKYSLTAGEIALSQFSNQEAIQHFSYVVNAVKDYPEFITEKMSALEGLGDAFEHNSMFKEATRTFEELGDAAESSSVKLRALRKAAESAFQQGNPIRVLELVKKTEPYAAADRLENARILVCRSRAFMLQSKIGYSKDLEDALQVFEEEYSLWDSAWTLMDVAGCHAGRGKGKDHQGLAEALRSIAMFAELGDFRSQMKVCFVAGYDFMNCLLYNEALTVYSKIITTNEDRKMDDYLHTCYAYAWSGVMFCFMGDYEKGLAYNLTALELSKKTDSLVAQGVVYSNLVRIYVLLGDMKRAEEYFQKLMKFPPEILNFNPVNGEFTKSVFLAGNGQWKAFEENFEMMNASPYPYWWSWLQGARLIHARMLERQGRVKEARIVSEKAKRIQRSTEKKFEHTNIQPSFMVHRYIESGEKVEMRLDLVNVGRNPGALVKVEGLIPSGSEIVSFPSFCSIHNSSIDMNGKRIDPFKVETIKLWAKFDKAGIYKLEPCIFYVDDSDETKACKIKPITLTVQFSPSEDKLKRSLESSKGKLDFKSEAAEKAFGYLVKAFEDDYINRRMNEEKCGWRTLMQVARNAHITPYSMYGRYRRGGVAMSELGHLGIVESRFFLGERGRSGRVLKIRIAYEKEFVRKLLSKKT